MIRVRLIKRPGFIALDCVGHGRTDVCCGASMIMQAAALGLRDLAKQFPREIEITDDCHGAPVGQFDSTDRRKKRPRQ